MQISLSKNSEVPLRHQLAEQVVFLITTGQLRAGEEMPSVRALARRLHVHHNTVSEAYQDLVHRKWLTRRQGSRLVVGTTAGTQHMPANLDELINEAILQAKELGYSLQELRARVRARLMAQPPDHILVVEEEPELRELIRREVQDKIGRAVEACSYEELVREPGLGIGAQVFAPGHVIKQLKPLLPPHLPPVAITYSPAEEPAALIRRLKKPSVIAIVSISPSLLKAARGLFAPVIGRKHVLQEVRVSEDGTRPLDAIDLDAIDLAICDSVAMTVVHCRRKFHYRLIPADTLEYLSVAVFPAL